VVAQSVNTTLIVGIFRAGGDTKFGLLLDTGIMWGVSILLGFFAAFVFHFPVEAVIVILLSDEIIKVPISLHRYRQYKWLNNVTRQG
jgi:Na+-driven multidrug efflux pump